MMDAELVPGSVCRVHAATMTSLASAGVAVPVSGSAPVAPCLLCRVCAGGRLVLCESRVLRPDVVPGPNAVAFPLGLDVAVASPRACQGAGVLP